MTKLIVSAVILAVTALASVALAQPKSKKKTWRKQTIVVDEG